MEGVSRFGHSELNPDFVEPEAIHCLSPIFTLLSAEPPPSSSPQLSSPNSAFRGGQQAEDLGSPGSLPLCRKRQGLPAERLGGGPVFVALPLLLVSVVMSRA